MRDRSRVLALGAILASQGGCGGKAPAAAAPAATASPTAKGAPAQLLDEVSPSRLFPELVGQRGVVATEEGQQRILVDRMRLVARADGSMERAAELLPAGSVSSVALPSRLGGGYLFHVNAGGGTEIWRAAGWLDKLRPLTRRSEVVSDAVPGFDRLYVRLTSGNRVIALDAQTGEQKSVGPLPVAGSYGALGFADGWRAVVDTDLRGPLATFDAGLTWRPLDLVGERPLGVGIIDGDPAVLVADGRYVVDARGGVTRRTDAREKGAPREHAEREEPTPSVEARRAGPLGRRPLRAAVEDGWPDSRTTAVVARGGALARVSLADGAVVALVEDAYPERRASCHAARLGLHGVGFLCGERDGPTVVYALAPPLSLEPVMRFDKPRFIAASGNGALVIRGRCDGEVAAVEEADARWYCVRSPAGVKREVRVKGFDLGLERVIGLGDGRVAVLVPPRGGSPGDLSIISVSGQATKVALKLPEEPAGVTRELKRGLWLDGFEERAPGVLGGWVEAGGPVVGVQVGLDGTVKAGELQGEASGAVFGGRFAVLLLDGQRALETSDGGMTWAGFDLPTRAEEARAVSSRGVGPVGASLPGWIRVGWGEPEAPDDMKPAEEPVAPWVMPRTSPTLALDCEVGAVSTPPLPEKAQPPAPVVVTSVRRGARAVSVRTTRETQSGWAAFRNTAPPTLAADEYGVDNGAVHDTIPLRAYAWGKKGADWSRTGRWLIRFDDRFDPVGGVRAAALTSSQWPDEAAATEAIGSGINSYGTTNWAGVLDPSGRALLASACRGSSCALYAVGDGQPVLPIRDASGRPGGFLRPVPHGAVRLGETWFFLGKTPSYDALSVWRVDLGAARTIGTYFRPSQHSTYEEPRLVRRALGGGVGLLVTGLPEPGERRGSWYVLPVNTETGELGEAVVLARRDFAGAALTRCAPEQDGWMLDVDISAETAVAIDVDGVRVQLDPVEMRVRLDPGHACVEGFAARSGPFYPAARAAAARTGPVVPLTAVPGKKGGAGERTLPLAATEKTTGRRWGLSCRIKPRK